MRTLSPSFQPSFCKACINAATRAFPSATSERKFTKHTDQSRPGGLLPLRSERPHGSPADNYDELAPFHARPKRMGRQSSHKRASGKGQKRKSRRWRRDVCFAPGERTLSGCIGISEKCQTRTFV